ncbi:MAG TPA: hydrolase, partial [Candidatus Binatia bacterium]
MREWESFFPEEERKIYEKAGYKGKAPFGRNPALLVIDMQLAFTGTKPLEIMEAIDEFPTSCGKAAWEAIPKIQQLIHACREASVPVVYSAGDPDFKAAMGNATKRKVGDTDFAELGGRFPDAL